MSGDHNMYAGGPAFPSTLQSGGPAFPSTLQYFPDDTSYHDCEGMTLRDYFAAKAMQGFLSAPDTGWAEEEMAEQAYKMADRMLEARKCLGGKHG